MKTLNQILFINETSEGTWTLSWLKPEFQGGESFEISKEDAEALMNVINK